MSDQNPGPDDPIFGDKPDNELSGPPASSPPPPPPPPSTPPPPPPSALPPPPPAGAGSSSLVSDAFSWAVQRFQQHAGIFVALAAVVFALRAAQTVIGNVLVDPGQPGVTFTAALGISMVLGIAFGVAAWLASIGVYRAALRRTQGVTPSFDQLTTGENLGSYIVVAIVLGIAVSVGILLCILPGLAVIFLFMFAPFFALDKGQSVGEAFGNSFQLVTQNIGTVVVAALVNIVATMLSGFLFGLLTLVMLPFAALFTAYVYRSLQGEPVAP